jgi:hypothetical protein
VHKVVFLDDKQAVQFMEAAQGDAKTNVLQAPRLTLLDGQASTIEVGEARSFVTGVTINEPLRAFVEKKCPSPANLGQHIARCMELFVWMLPPVRGIGREAVGHPPLKPERNTSAGWPGTLPG